MTSHGLRRHRLGVELQASVLCREGLHVSLDFFDDIFIPEHALKDPQHFDEVRLMPPDRDWQHKSEQQVSLLVCKEQHVSAPVA